MGIVAYGVGEAGRMRGNNGNCGRPARWIVVGRVAALIIALGLSVGCESEGSHSQEASPIVAGSAQDLRSTPCEVVTRSMVSSTFAVAAADIEQSSMSSLCAYRWEGEGDLLDVTVHVSAVTEDAAQARLLFEQATASDFQDVAGLGDQARIDTGNGDMHVRDGGLYFTLNAYYGPAMPKVMPMPVPASAVDARAEWWQGTIPQRRQAAMRLVRASADSVEKH